ncbi:hypothetical protein DPMN_026553 [Dreissena polymorpha]|uniref:Uncharacterized protein n=1 Tax=Dreissena polymorpha TaxID=45954 RepID=A0A9D4RCU6_DREPO|nr:hypothetical protein DPMN_026553 [Dreissena polymorpha]
MTGGIKEKYKIQYLVGRNFLSPINIIGTNLLTKNNAPPPGSHFHEDRTVNVASRVLTRFYYSYIRKNAPPLGSQFVQANIIIFELIQDIIETKMLTKFHEDWTINVASRVVLTRKNSPPLFHDDPKINVTSRVLTRKIAPPPWWPYIIGMNLLTEFNEDRTIKVASRVKNAPPLGSHVFQTNVTNFELIQDINKINLLTIFHEDWTINVASRLLIRKNARPPGGHVFQPTDIIFKLVQDIIWINLLTKKNAPPLGSHVFQANVTIFKLIQDIIKSNLLTKFHEDWTINVASRELRRQMLTPHNAQRKTDDGRRTKSDHKSST